jgi:hypothetical protein
MFHLWRRMDQDHRKHVWRLYGWFSGLMMCGSIFGAATWAARMTYFVNFYPGNDSVSQGKLAQGYAFFAAARRGTAVFRVSYAVEFMCLSAAKLLVLDRLSHLIYEQGKEQGNGRRKWWVVGGRILMVAVALANAAGVSANFAAAVELLKSSWNLDQASALYAANNTKAGLPYVTSSRALVQLATSITSVQAFCEVASLLLIIAAFAVAGVVCARHLSSALSVLDTAGAELAADMRIRRQVRQQAIGDAVVLGKQMRREIIFTTGFVFVAFLLRSVTSTILAVAFQFQDTANACSKNLCDASCANVFTLMSYWNTYTPEFQTTVVLISSPLALLVALWGATTKRALQLMRSGKQQPFSVSMGLTSPKESSTPR